MFCAMVYLCFAILVLLTVFYARMWHKYTRKAIVAVSGGSTSAGKSEKVIRYYDQAPGPKPWPIIGNLNLLANHKENPFEAFTHLAGQYGDIFSLTLGSTRCLVVNNLELIREVLNQNGKFFGGRPNFLRYHKLFGGDRNNSLALCDWSQLQQKRRNLARRHCSPRESSSYFTKMSLIGSIETGELMDKLDSIINGGQPFEIKPLIQQTCANMFCQYMCSTRFNYEDTEFQKIVYYFDEIFWEINQGYPLDFMPWLSLFYKQHTNKIVHWSTTIRQFILDRVINDRELNIDLDEPDNDFTDALLKSLIEDKNVSRNTIIFMLEDFIGGHSAVGNLVMLALTYIAKNPCIGEKIQMETDMISNQRKINLYDMESMPYTMATIFEVLRYSSSPIVPHVATEDSVISGYGVTAGTIVFINNYILNTTEKYWTKPEVFDPTRFLEKNANSKVVKKMSDSFKTDHNKRRNSEGSDSGVEIEKDNSIHASQSESSISQKNYDKRDEEQSTAVRISELSIKKNIPHFLPFSIGKRTCIGQNLVRGFGFILLANILQSYDVSCQDFSLIKITPACVALPATTFPLVLTPRLRKSKSE